MSEKKVPRPLPKIGRYTDTKPFWDAAKQHRLLLQYCTDTGRPQWFPRSVSLYTGRRNLEWREAAGEGTVYSYTVIRQMGAEPFASELPYVVAMVELLEGPRMLGNITGVKPDEVKVGMPVEVYMMPADDEVAVPFWRAAR